MAHAIVRTDNLSGIVDGSKLATARYYVSTTPTDIDNGTVLSLDGLDSDAPERFTWKAVAPAADAAADGTLVLVATPEMLYDKKYFDLGEYYNVAGTYLRGYILEQGDVFSVTKEGFTDGATATTYIPAAGDGVSLDAAGKLKKNTGTGSSAAKFAKCVKIENAGNKTFYVLRVL